MSVYIIAELGINHNGSMDYAQQLIQVAKDAGAQAVKFQKRDINSVYTKEELDKPRESPWGLTNRAQKEGLEFTEAQYVELGEMCYDAGMQWSASCWDALSVEFIASLNPPWLKIPSALLTNTHLLDVHVRTGIPLLLSTGMSTIAEIDEAVERLDQAELTILHCTSSYPCPLEETNLRCIPELKRYNKRVGFSSHGKSFWPCLGAVALGAEVIEAHLTLDHTMYGSDQSASLEPPAFKKLVTEIRDMEKALGDGHKIVYESELPIRAKLRK